MIIGEKSNIKFQKFHISFNLYDIRIYLRYAPFESDIENCYFVIFEKGRIELIVITISAATACGLSIGNKVT